MVKLESEKKYCHFIAEELEDTRRRDSHDVGVKRKYLCVFILKLTCLLKTVLDLLATLVMYTEHNDEWLNTQVILCTRCVMVECVTR